jgi:5-methylcytosine-specific restriction endonuclease McrA
MAIACTHDRPQCPVCQKVLTLGSTHCIRHMPRLKRGPELTCARCGKTFTIAQSTALRGAKFCSWGCAREDRGYGQAMLHAECPTCGKSFERRLAYAKRAKGGPYCTKECSDVARRGDGAFNWRGGHKGYRGAKWPAIRAQVRERDNYQCRRCGKPETENGGKQLSIDHVVPYRMFETADEANELDNLVALCNSCHGRKTHGAEHRFIQNGDWLALEAFRRSVGL